MEKSGLENWKNATVHNSSEKKILNRHEERIVDSEWIVKPY